MNKENWIWGRARGVKTASRALSIFQENKSRTLGPHSRRRWSNSRLFSGRSLRRSGGDANKPRSHIGAASDLCTDDSTFCY